MRTVVNTTKRTTYVVTDRDIIEALVGLGIPRSVLLSEDTTIKMDEETRGEGGFYFTDDENIDTFLTVEGPVEVTAAESAKIAPTPAPEPANEPVKEEVYPNGTVLTGQSTGATYVIIDYYYQTREYNIESLKDYRRYTEPRHLVHNHHFYKVVQPYPEGTVLIGQASGNRYTVVKYNDLTKGYTLRRDDFNTFEEARCAHNPALFTVAPTPAPEPAPAPARLPIGSVVKFKHYDGTEDLCYITGYVNTYGEGYSMWSVRGKFETWDRYSEVDKVGGPYTVVHKADPSKATPTFLHAFPVGTVLKHASGFVSVLTGHRGHDIFGGGGYTTYTNKWGEGFDYHYNLDSNSYTVLYNPSNQSNQSEQDEQSKT